MKRTVNTKLLKQWCLENRPNAVGKLNEATKIPVTSLQKIQSGRAPLSEERQERLAQKIGVSVDDLFPLLRKSRNKAS